MYPYLTQTLLNIHYETENYFNAYTENMEILAIIEIADLDSVPKIFRFMLKNHYIK